MITDLFYTYRLIQKFTTCSGNALLGRPGRPSVLQQMFFLFNSPLDLRAHSADRHETLTHDRHLGALYNPSPKIWWGLSPTKFRGLKTCEIWRDFTQLPTLIDNISGTRQDIQNRKDM